MPNSRREVDLGKLREQYRGTTLRELIQHHRRATRSAGHLQNGIDGTRALLSSIPGDVIDAFVSEWLARVAEGTLLDSDTGLVFDAVVRDARSVLYEFGMSGDDEAVFNLFQLVVLQITSTQIGRSPGHLPLVSTLALVSILLVNGYWWFRDPIGPVHFVGNVFASLGYALVVAGVNAGTFRALALTRRSVVLTAAVVSLATGTLLVNVAP